MRSPALQLTLTHPRFSLMPLPGRMACACMSSWSCRNLASHRITTRTPAIVVLLCDDHTIEWTLHQALSITKSNPAA
jgi:hypothetical protein